MHIKIAIDMEVWISEVSDYKGIRISEGPLYCNAHVQLVINLPQQFSPLSSFCCSVLLVAALPQEKG